MAPLSTPIQAPASYPSIPSPQLSASNLSTAIPNEKPLASTNGGSLAITIALAEPILFLQGFDRTEFSHHTPAMLRGTLHVTITKATKIKSIMLNFSGRGRTNWPEGIPPAKDEFYEDKELMTHFWPFFNAQFLSAESSFGADLIVDPQGMIHQSSDVRAFLKNSSSSTSRSSFSRERSSSGSRRRSSSRSSRDSLGESRDSSVSNKGYKSFPPGTYSYNFELPIDSSLPESIECAMGNVKYELEAVVDRSGAFKPKLIGRKPVFLIRSPSEASQEAGEPIVVSRTWEDQLHYDIVIGGKAFPIGSTVPVAFKLTPLAKVRCHRIRILLSENTEYYCRNKKVHRIEPVRKYLLFEHQAGEDMSQNLLGDLEGLDTAGPVELEFGVKIPGCNIKNKEKLRPDTTYVNIKVHHWIKIILRLSRSDPADPNKRRHFEVSIDSPFRLLSCRCTTANVSLPAYNLYAPTSTNMLPPCPCELGENGTDNDPVPIPEDNARPLHILRRPSVNPPPFDADVPPPPLVTPPPQYNEIAGEDDYFGRRNYELEVDEEEDEDSDRELSSTFRSSMIFSADSSTSSLSGQAERTP
ncbi:uncharacterized protein V1510DRAFT_370687 [Dipodascopsis tothii]|uniref:uncharacterized protein n=1 Tax=Dipodascopsis tothii TaxID=44089 RepID=UPI0034CD0418